MRLNAFIAKSGVCSRRKAALLVKEGKVTHNGVIVREPYLEVADNDNIEVDGKPLQAKKHAYLIFNKPKGVTTTCLDKFADKKVTDYIPERFGRLYPVGRLDKDSRGLIILTNDGASCYALTHPKFEVEKEYLVTVKGVARRRHLDSLKKGVEDDGDFLKVKSASLQASSKDTSVISAVVAEGKKRHLRRLFKRLGFTVIDLERVRIGDIHLGSLKEGAYKVIEKPLHN